METQKGSDAPGQDGSTVATTAVPTTPSGHVGLIDGASLEYAAVPVFLFAAVATAMAAAMPIVGSFFGPNRQGAVKAMPYESGMDPIHDTRRRFDVRFHLVAIAFLVFDVELLFLYPWAVAMRPAHHRPVAQAAAVAAAEPAAAPLAAPIGAGTPSKSSDTDLPHPNQAPVVEELPLGIDAAVGYEVESRGLVFAGAMAFIAMLTVGLVYDWKKGVFQWR
jgi:NADH-quinone oxidoreductase subunit A